MEPLIMVVLDKKKVENAPERMRVEAARYVGADNRGQKFSIEANSAIQRNSEIPVVDISGMRLIDDGFDPARAARSSSSPT